MINSDDGIITTWALFIDDMPVLFSMNPDDDDFKYPLRDIRPEYLLAVRIGRWTGTYPLTGSVLERSTALLEAAFDNEDYHWIWDLPERHDGYSL